MFDGLCCILYCVFLLCCVSLRWKSCVLLVCVALCLMCCICCVLLSFVVMSGVALCSMCIQSCRVLLCWLCSVMHLRRALLCCALYCCVV